MWAQVISDQVTEVTDLDPRHRYHPDIVWRECSPEIKPGWRVQNGKFTPPLDQAQEDQVYAMRTWRDLQLQSSEWLVMRHRDELAMDATNTLSSAQYSELLSYRQALRDWPSSTNFPDRSARPEPPLWLSRETQ
ncbi:phage tail assembly chaperone [Pseudomonas faucium]|uniref:phage tail assembly chaperone n=1 Tax=Pseudomonas faucium TaxID=2740518 RepID=UPI00159702A1|nr:phage tail assembly chaperone [Pseudomonas faucium]